MVPAPLILTVHGTHPLTIVTTLVVEATQVVMVIALNSTAQIILPVHGMVQQASVMTIIVRHIRMLLHVTHMQVPGVFGSLEALEVVIIHLSARFSLIHQAALRSFLGPVHGQDTFV